MLLVKLGGLVTGQLLLLLLLLHDLMQCWLLLLAVALPLVSSRVLLAHTLVVGLVSRTTGRSGSSSSSK
jgi:hypothetical protein